jgi:hypothetical protein
MPMIREIIIALRDLAVITLFLGAVMVGWILINSSLPI